MTIETALIAGSVAVSAASAAAQYGATKAQASAGMAGARLKQEGIDLESQTVALRAREEEGERRRRAGLVDQEVVATAAAFGVDPYASGSVQTLRGESQRLAEADMSSIRMLGAARQRALAIQGRGAQLEENTYSSMSKNAWVRPTLSLLGSGFSAYRAGGFGGGDAGGGASPNLSSLDRVLSRER